MQKITPCFFFTGNNLEEAFNFYASVFKDAKVKITRVPGGNGGETIVGDITIHGQEFKALQGDQLPFQFNESISFYVSCDDQKEVDYYWSKLTANGGQESVCGWLKDKFGVSWQITPKKVFSMLEDKDKAKVGRAMDALMKMKKIDLKTMEDAFNNS